MIAGLAHLLLQVDVVSGIIDGFSVVLSWPTILFAIAGTLIGLVFGSLPGLGATVAIVLLIPITYGQVDTNTAAILFASALGGTAFGGSISAILINTPGTGPNAATLLDGYPLAKQGKAANALGASALASASGAIFGLFVLIASLPFLLQFILLFGPAEKFMIAIFGLSIIAVATRGKIVDGLIAGGFGLLISFIGRNPITGVNRFTLDSVYLISGIQLIPAILGVFAVAEIINLGVTRSAIAEADVKVEGSTLEGMRSVIQNPYIFFQSSIIGVLIGAIPGAGGSVATFVAYVRASQSVDDPESFGQGNIQGVIAAEAANDAKDGGALIPTLALGVPGSGAMAVLLAGLVLHGVAPGPALFQENIEVVFVLIGALIVANVLTSSIGVTVSSQLARITQVNPIIIVSIVLSLALIGTFIRRQLFGDVLVTLLFGIIGYHMKAFDFSRIALIIALVLGEFAELNYFKVIQIQGPQMFFTRPISLGLLIITVLSLILPTVRHHIRQRS